MTESARERTMRLLLMGEELSKRYEEEEAWIDSMCFSHSYISSSEIMELGEMNFVIEKTKKSDDQE